MSKTCVMVRFLFTFLTVNSLAGCSDTRSDYIVEDIEQSKQPLGSLSLPRFSALSAGSDEQGPLRKEAIAKCSSVYDPAANAERHEACVKMFTAQYFNDISKSYTFTGTLIEWADADTPLGKAARPLLERIDDPVTKEYVGQREFEAIWDSSGALCLRSPRHLNLYQANIPPGRSIRSCLVDPKDPTIPWIGNPFPGSGMQLISYRINFPGELSLVRDAVADTLYLGYQTDPRQTVLETVHIPGAGGWIAPIRERLPKSNPPRYETAANDLNLVWLHESCDSSVPAKCDHITTSFNLYDGVVRSRLKLASTATFVTKPFLGWGYVFKNPQPNTVQLQTYRIYYNGRYRYVTTTEKGLESLGYIYFEPLQTEGYVYQNRTTDITP